MPNCLVVDDSDVVRKVARRILESLKYTVSEARTGEEALECCRQVMPDVILLDWQTPRMNGFEFLSKLAVEFPTKTCHIVYCISENDSAEIARAFGVGAGDYLLKPYTRSDLAARLAETPAATKTGFNGRSGPLANQRAFAASRP